MLLAKPKSIARIALVIAPLALALSACETLENLNPFDDAGKKTPLSGDRRALFPNGVPGVQYNAPPTQPTNSNVQIQPQQNPENNPDAQPQAEQPQQAPQKQTRNQKKGATNADEDPWTGARR